MNEAALWGGFFLPPVFYTPAAEALSVHFANRPHSVAYAPQALYLRAYGQEVSSFP